MCIVEELVEGTSYYDGDVHSTGEKYVPVSNQIIVKSPAIQVPHHKKEKY